MTPRSATWRFLGAAALVSTLLLGCLHSSESPSSGLETLREAVLITAVIGGAVAGLLLLGRAAGACVSQAGDPDLRRPAQATTLTRAMKVQLVLEALATVALFLGVGAAAVFGLWHQTRRVIHDELSSELLNLTAAAATVVDPAAHAGFTDPQQTNSPRYNAAIRPLRDFAAAVPSVKYVYTYVRDGDTVRFVFDTAEAGDQDGDGVEDHSQVWERYDNAEPAMLEALGDDQTPGRAICTGEPSADRWGSFVSGYAPLRTAPGERPGSRGAVGIDIDTAQYERRLTAARDRALGGVVPTIIIALGASVCVFSHRRRMLLVECSDRDARARAERLAEIARRTVNGVIVTDASGRIEWVNEGFTRITGYGLAEVVGRKPGHVLQGPGSDRAEVDKMRDAIRAGLATTTELVNYRKNGERYVTRIELAPLRDGRGRLTGFMAIESDVTAQRRAEHAIAESEQRLRTLVEGLDLIVWEYDPQSGVYTYVSPQAARLGYLVEEWTRPGFWRRALHPEDRDAAMEFRRSETNSGRSARFQYRLLTADGEVVWMDDFMTAERSRSGDPVVRGVLVDITDRKRIEEARRSATEMLNRTGAMARVGGWEYEVATQTLTWSEVVYQIHELEPGTPVDVQAAVHFYAPHARPLIAAAIERCLKDGTPWDLELPMTTARGKPIHVRAQGQPVWSGGRVVTLRGAFQDVTALRQAALAADAANRAKSEFLANMSHEIRTPLTAILGFTDLLAEEPDTHTPESRRAAIDTIRSAGEHLLAVINDILDISKVEANRMVVEHTRTDLPALLAGVRDLMRPRAQQKGLALRVVEETPIPQSVMTDPTRLRQVLMNLVGNAVKFTESGRVEIRVAVEKHGGGATLRVDVEDTGPGIAPELVDLIFTPFVQADSTVTRRYGGTGLGLVICQRLTRLMGGDVALTKTSIGRGSVFTATFTLGTCDESPAAAPVSPEAPARVIGTVLLAEDGIDNQRLILHHLRRAGANVEVAFNGRIALEMIAVAENAGRPYDLILTDIQMPEVDGYTLARTLRERGTRTAIVALTAHAMPEDRQRCLDAGCDDYATKPIDKRALIATCARWVGRNSEARVTPTFRPN